MRRLQPVLGIAALLAWLAYLWAYVPAVSRGDFFLALVRLARSVESGDVLYAWSWPFHVLGGHIVFYERVVQLLNYYVFGFSPLVVKLAAMLAWALLGVAAYRFVRRQPIGEGARAFALAAIALLSFSALPWLSVVWADATIPYLAPTIALLLVAPALTDAARGGWSRAPKLKVALCCIAVIAGSGAGWAVLPAMAGLFAFAAAEGARPRAVLAAIATLAAGALAALAVLHFYGPELRLTLVSDSLANLGRHPVAFAGYLVSLFATFFGVTRRPWNLVFGALFIAVSLWLCVRHRRRTGGTSEAELVYVVGMLAMLLVALGRWKLAHARGEVNPPTYYHLFALPAYYGAIAMGLAEWGNRTPGKAAWTAVAAWVTVFVALSTHEHRNLRGTRDNFVQMIPAVQGWRMSEASRLIGEPETNQELFLEFLPMLQRAGKYPELSGRFHPWKSSRMAPPAPSAERRSCAGQPDLLLLHTSPDQRQVYGTLKDRPDYRRFVGAARDPARCGASGVAVSLVAADGTVMCRSWTTPNVHWAYEVPAHRAIASSPFAFDFTCPVERGSYFLVSQDGEGHAIAILQVLP